jgi:uncharacterized membrane protein
MKKNLLDSIITWVGTPSSLVVHTLFFVFMLSLRLFGVALGDVLLILTTVVSLEAIYLSIFIQMGVNRQADEQKETRNVLSNGLHTLQETMDEVQETMEEVQETVEEVQETVDEEENSVKPV